MKDDGTVLRLAPPKKKGLMGLVFSRLFLVVFLLAIQILLLVSMVIWLRQYLPYYAAIQIIFTFCIILFLFNCEMDYSAKLTWLALIALFPFPGAVFLAYTQTNLGHRWTQSRTAELIAQLKELQRAIVEGKPFSETNREVFLKMEHQVKVFDFFFSPFGWRLIRWAMGHPRIIKWLFDAKMKREAWLK